MQGASLHVLRLLDAHIKTWGYQKTSEQSRPKFAAEKIQRYTLVRISSFKSGNEEINHTYHHDIADAIDFMEIANNRSSITSHWVILDNKEQTACQLTASAGELEYAIL